MATAHETLKKYWGFDSFRPLQEDIVKSVLDGRDTLALLPTGGGKSICFQVPGLMREGVCLVISPLIALMKDQVINLRKKNLKAEALVSGMSKREREVILDNAVFGKLDFLYVSPERLKSEDFRLKLGQMKISLIAVDEAHCISQWGYDFRPPYLEIAEVRDILGGVPVLALTATAQEQVVDDIQERLHFKQKNLFRKSFERPNLAYMVFEEHDKYGRLLNILHKTKGTGIVYMRSRKGTMKLAQFLKERGISAEAYHAGLNSEIRSKRQKDWIEDRTQIMVATNAFGMGIDKPNVRVVVHLELPDSLESYFQEAGRAGRDEEEAFAVMLYQEEDIVQLRERQAERFPGRKKILRVYQALGNYLQLPEGSGEGVEFEFDVYKFSKRFDFVLSEVYHSLKILEKEGYINLLEDPKLASRVQMLGGKRDIYDHEEHHAKDSKVLQVLLRNHTSIFDHPVKIRESKLAARIGMPEDEFVHRLETMSQVGLLEYTPKSRNPRILYTAPRIRMDNVLIDGAGLKRRKKEDKYRTEEVVRYLKGEYCRSRLLLKYFGERSEEDCGKCDVCIRKRSQGVKAKNLIRQDVEKVLESEMKLSELVMSMNFDGTVVYQEVRAMVDEGLLEYDQERDLISKKS